MDLQCCVWGVQQLDSVIHIHRCIVFWILFPWGLLECCIISLAIQEDLFDLLYYVYESVSINPNLLIHPSHPNLPSGNPICFETLWVSLCYVNEFISVSFGVPTVSDLIRYLSFSVQVTSLSVIMSRSIQMSANGIISSFLIVIHSRGRVRPFVPLWTSAHQASLSFTISLFLWLNNSPFYTWAMSFPVHLTMDTVVASIPGVL